MGSSNAYQLGQANQEQVGTPTRMNARERKAAERNAKAVSSLERKRKNGRRSLMSSSRPLEMSPSKTRVTQDLPRVPTLIAQFGQSASPLKLPTTRPASATGRGVQPVYHQYYPQTLMNIEQAAQPKQNLKLETGSQEKKTTE